MMNLRKHLRTANIFFFLIISIFFFESCNKEAVEKKYVARVNNSYLTQNELDSIFSSSSGIQYKSEIIRNWINKELLFQEARKQGILKESNFKQIMDNSQKELAASFLINNFFGKIEIDADDTKLEEYYKQNADEFRLAYKSYLVNLISFNNEDKALKFRSLAVEKNWNYAVSEMHQDTSLLDENNSNLLYEYEVQPVSVLRILKELYPSEVSIVINNNGTYVVVQLLEKFDKGSLPPFDLIRDEIKKSYLAEKRELTIKNYIKDLYSKNDIEVKN